MQIEFAAKVQSMLATVVGCKRYDINGKRFGKIFLMQEAEQNEGSWGLEPMSMSCPYELLDVLQKEAPGQVMDVQFTTRMGKEGKMAYTCVGVLPVQVRKPQPAAPAVPTSKPAASA